MTKFELLLEYWSQRNEPNWLEYHIASTVYGIDWMGYSEEEKKAVRIEEHKKILRFCELMEDANMTDKEAEAQVWPESVEFYKEFEKMQKELERWKAERKKPKPEMIPVLKKRKGARLSNRLYLEKELSQKQRDNLLAKGYRRLKISPFGTSGAAYYWVRTRYNESKEHAFFCYLLEAELKKHIEKVVMNVNSGPDAVVEHKGKKYCFDVETGKSLARQPKFLKRKFDWYRKEFYQSYILVTNKSLKYKHCGVRYIRPLKADSLRRAQGKQYDSADSVFKW